MTTAPPRPRRSTAWVPWLLLGIVVVGALAWAGVRAQQPATPAERTRALASQLRCLECQGLSVADSRTTTAVAMKADIRRRVDAGETDGQIKRAYVDRYGEYVLLDPPRTNWALWLLPIVVIVGGGAVIVSVVVRASRRPRLGASDDDRAVVDAARRTVDPAGPSA